MIAQSMSGDAEETGLRLSAPCAIEEVRALAGATRNFLLNAGVQPQTVEECQLALVEACNNAILYVSDVGRSHPIAVEIFCTPSKIRMQVHDHTLGFDWPAHLELPDPESESGRGLFLIQTLMDSVRYVRSAEGNNTLTLSKKR